MTSIFPSVPTISARTIELTSRVMNSAVTTDPSPRAISGQSSTGYKRRAMDLQFLDVQWQVLAGNDFVTRIQLRVVE